MKTLHKIGVVGAGTMGSALAQKFAQEGFRVILADREMEYVEKGITGITTTLNEGVEKGVFKEEQVKGILSRLQGTANLKDLQTCDLILEAIYEDLEAKKALFKKISGIVPRDAVLATNTSSFSVTELAASVTHPERFIGLHYFYHAAKNRLVEIIPGAKTAPEIFERMRVFCALSGKDAITCRDAYGFVVNRYFVPWLNEAVRLYDEGVANIATIEDVCVETFRIGMGPFALMNATGIPVAYHAQSTLEVFGEFYNVSNRLRIQVKAGEPWSLDGEVSKNEATRQVIRERMLGEIFLVCAQLLDERICTATAINRGARIGLRWQKGPVELMKRYGEEEVKRLTRQMAGRYQVNMPRSIGEQFWAMDFVTLEKSGDRAVIRIERPEDLNALNEEVLKQFDTRFTQAEHDDDVKTIFITGSGKAFVAGADIKFFVENMKKNTIDNIVNFTSYGQQIFDKVDRSRKKIIAVINGITLGGGLELALCADVILAVPNAVMAFPETGIGIYPALGGTQRCARRTGKGLAKYLILTGQSISAHDAVEIHLVDAIVAPGEMFDMFEGKMAIPRPVVKALEPKWSIIANMYTKNAYTSIISGEYVNGNMDKEEAHKLARIMISKAPIAMRIAEDLIEEASGCDSELQHLKTVFTSSDALRGLTSIGKRVTYEGK